MGGRHPRRVIGCGLRGERREVGRRLGRGGLPRAEVVEREAEADQPREHALGHAGLRRAAHERDAREVVVERLAVADAAQGARRVEVGLGGGNQEVMPVAAARPFSVLLATPQYALTRTRLASAFCTVPRLITWIPFMPDAMISPPSSSMPASE